MKGIFSKSSDWEAIYPVGSIYMSVSSTSPASLFGGTWTQLKDQFLLCAGSSYTAGSTGGAANHIHSTGDLALTTSQLPAHTHNSKSLSGTLNAVMMDDGRSISASGICSIAVARARSWAGTDGTASYIATINATHTHDSVGSGATHNHGNTGSTSNMPPYLAVYVWKRTA